jgi:hypothetical protein
MKCTNCNRIIDSGITCACGYCLDCIVIKHPETKFREIKKSLTEFMKKQEVKE